MAINMWRGNVIQGHSGENNGTIALGQHNWEPVKEVANGHRVLLACILGKDGAKLLYLLDGPVMECS